MNLFYTMEVQTARPTQEIIMAMMHMVDGNFAGPLARWTVLQEQTEWTLVFQLQHLPMEKVEIGAVLLAHPTLR